MENMYSLSCILWLSLVQSENDFRSRVTGYSRFVYSDRQFWSVMLHIFLLPEGNQLDKMVVAL